ncbi:MAG TPA: hypothetical protein VN704_00335, partial [Verrucomicrobiae bacterium]|nr:hypothetical protein [Verrucomicrobiae bacterium]
SLVTVLGQRKNNGGNKYKIIDIDSSEIYLDDLFRKYFFNEKHHTFCSVVVTKPFSNNNAREEGNPNRERQKKIIKMR